jgi:hypothetical protein
MNTAHLVTAARLSTVLLVVLSLASLVFSLYRMIQLYRGGALSRRRGSQKSASHSHDAVILHIPDIDSDFKIEPFHGELRTSRNTASSHIDVKIQQVKTPQQNVRVGNG